MRRMWSHLAEEGDMGEVDATEKLLESFRRTSTNEEFLNTLPRGASDNGRF
jgi:transcription termination factor Rho